MVFIILMGVGISFLIKRDRLLNAYSKQANRENKNVEDIINEDIDARLRKLEVVGMTLLLMGGWAFAGYLAVIK